MLNWVLETRQSILNGQIKQSSISNQDTQFEEMKKTAESPSSVLQGGINQLAELFPKVRM